ncbi:MAG: FHA domain-containing protein [bacterium]
MMSLDALRAAVDAEEARRRADRAARVEALDPTLRLALQAVPLVNDAVAGRLGLVGLDAAVADGVVVRVGEAWRLADPPPLDDGALRAGIIGLGHALAGPDLPPVVERWATLARLADAPEAFAEALMDRVRGGSDGVRWVEAGRALQGLLGGRLRLGVARAARALLLAERREEDRRALRHFVLPAALKTVFEELWHPDRFALHLQGAGGVGKTTFLRHLTAELAPAMQAVVARLDFDHLDARYPERDPGLLLAHLAEDLLLQADRESAEDGLIGVGRLADRVREGLSGLAAGAPDEAEIQALVEAFGDALQSLGGPVLLLFDTCEELARRRADGQPSRAVEETLRRVEALQARAPNVRVIFSGRWPLPPRGWLRVQALAGFDAGDADRYLAGRSEGCSPPPAWVTRPALRQALLERSRADRHYSPFELSWRAAWIEAEPQISEADLRDPTADRYVELRILGRLTDPDVRSLLPAAARLGTFDVGLLRGCVDLPEVRLASAFAELARQEWVAAKGEWLTLDERVRARLARGADDARVAAALLGRLLSGAPGMLFAGLAARWLTLEPTGIKEDWEKIVARVERQGEWAWLAREVEQAAVGAGHPLAVTATADGLAAARWLDRPVSARAFKDLIDLATVEQRLMLRAAAAAAEPAVAAGTWVAALLTAPASALADPRAMAACLAAGRALERPLANAALGLERLAHPLAAALAGTLRWQAGERSAAAVAWRRALAVPAEDDGPRLHLAGVASAGRLAAAVAVAGLVPACASAAEVRALPGAGAASTAVWSRWLGPQHPIEPALAVADAPEAAAELRAHALRRPEHAPRLLDRLAALRDAARRRSDAQHDVQTLAAAGAEVVQALRVADAWGFGETLALQGTPAAFDRVQGLSTFCGAVFDTVLDCDEPDSTHALWRHQVDPTALLARLAEHQAASADLQLDAWEAVQLADFDDVTLMLDLDAWQPERSLRRAGRGAALKAAGAVEALPAIIDRLGPAEAGLLLLDEAEHLALRLPATALGLFDRAADALGAAGDGFGVLRARVGQALAAMAVPDLEAAVRARGQVALGEATPAAWRQRADLVAAWVAEGGRLGGLARAILAAWSGPKPPLLPRIELASPVAPPPQSAAPGRQALHFNEGAQGRTFWLEAGRVATIGRHPDCDLRLLDPSISRRHAQVLLGPAGVTITDLGSSAGIYANDRHVQEATLRPGIASASGRPRSPSARPSTTGGPGPRGPTRHGAAGAAPVEPVVDAQPADLEEIFEKALMTDLADPERRGLLLSGLPRGLAASLPMMSRPADQVRSDLQMLQRMGDAGAGPAPPRPGSRTRPSSTPTGPRAPSSRGPPAGPPRTRACGCTSRSRPASSCRRPRWISGSP